MKKTPFKLIKTFFTAETLWKSVFGRVKACLFLFLITLKSPRDGFLCSASYRNAHQNLLFQESGETQMMSTDRLTSLDANGLPSLLRFLLRRSLRMFAPPPTFFGRNSRRNKQESHLTSVILRKGLKPLGYGCYPGVYTQLKPFKMTAH